MIDRQRSWDDRLRSALGGKHAAVLGGAGFLGLHLCDRLVSLGARVTIVDSFVPNRFGTARPLPAPVPGVTVVRADICDSIPVEDRVDFVLNLASIASPPEYSRRPIETLRSGSLGTENALRLAEKDSAIFLQASTSEVYGDPTITPQSEDYWGQVNPIGPRSMYDEAKRYAEAVTSAYSRGRGVQVRIPRIFNTYGPGMRVGDGRAVPEFIEAALTGRPLPVHGTGRQTRSLCFVDDMIEGLVRLLITPYSEPVNLGNPDEITIKHLAETIVHLTGSSSQLRFYPRPVDDPERRSPDISLARRLLDFEPMVQLEAGISKTIVALAEARDLSIDVSPPREFAVGS